MDFFKGFIYSVAIYNYKKDGSISPKACGCQNCTEEGDCLVNCKKNEYFSKGCKKCNSDCEFGCSNNENCVLHTDPYCEVFDELNTTCIKCINNTRTNTFPCQCISQGVYVMKENSCKCPDGFLIYKNACDECIRYLQPYDLDSYFLESFLEIIFDFNITLKQISCLDIFFKKDLSKFGKDFECEFNQNNTYLKIKLGKGFTLRNETIEINPTKLRGLYQECGYDKLDLSSKLRYTADIPTPVALIQMFDRISLKCQDLVADGSLSTGQLLDGLMYEWTVSEGLSEYSKIFSSDSVLVIPKKKLIPGNYTVFLTVKNKFDQTNSTYSDIEVLETETLEAKFDPLVDFICQASQDCIFPIKKLISCFPNPVISIKWEFTKGYQRLSNDQLNKFWLSQTIPSAVIIPANLFKPSSLTFRLTLTETSKMIQVSKEIRIKIKADPPKIAISRASGSISSLESLSIDATIPTDESTQIIYKWTCFYQSAPCSFYYDEANPILFVPLNITSLRIFDQFKLQVTTTTESASRYLQESETLSNSVSFNCKFVSWVVPKVNIYEIGSGEQPKVFSFSRVVRLTASLKDSGDFSYKWRIDGFNDSVFVSDSNQIAVGIDTQFLAKGLEYKLILGVIDSKKHLSEFEYEFRVNSPPKLGVFTVMPEEGVELETDFYLSAVDWVDEEENYPMSYVFGVYLRNRSNVLIQKSSSYYYQNLKMPFFGNLTTLFVWVYDSLDDYSEALIDIRIRLDPGLNVSTVTESVGPDLQATLIPDLPAQLYSKIITVFNREQYIDGTFSSPLNSSNETNQKIYNIISDHLELYINSSIDSVYMIDTSAGILLELNQNPYIASFDNYNNTLYISSILLNSSNYVDTGIRTSETILASTGKALYMNSIEQSPKQAKSQEKFLNSMSLKLSNSLLPEETITIDSEKMTIDLKSVGVKISDSLISNSKNPNAKLIIPSEYFQLISSQGISQLLISQTFVNISSSSNTSIVSVSIFLQETQLSPLLQEGEFEITIPYKNVSNILNPVCVFLNSSQKWDKTGCHVKELTSKSIICRCSHLTMFSGGDINSGFFPSNNFDETTEIKSIKNLNATSAIGFYFIGVLLSLYFIMGANTLFRDYRDIKELYIELERKNFKRLDPESQGIDEKENLAFDIENYQNEDLIGVKSFKELFLQSFKRVFERHKFFTIYHKYDPNSARFARISLICINLVGKMYFIGLFYVGATSKDSSVNEVIKGYSYRDFLVAFWSNLIILVIDLIFYKLMKRRPLDPGHPREIFYRNLKFNIKKQAVVMIVYSGLLVYFSWGIIMFAKNLETYISYKWIVNTTASIFFTLFINPFVKVIIVDILIMNILLFAKRKMNTRQTNSGKVVPSSDNYDVVSFGDAL